MIFKTGSRTLGSAFRVFQIAIARAFISVSKSARWNTVVTLPTTYIAILDALVMLTCL